MKAFSRVIKMLAPGLVGEEGGASKGKGTGRKIALVGNPNVGKSVLFGNLTGQYATVSNYPGTTVEVSRGIVEIEGERFEVVDTPGMYSLLPLSEDERVARKILLEEKPDVVVHVVDGKNLERMLILTMQLMEGGWKVVLVVNMMDEAEGRGLAVDTEALERELGIAAVGTVGPAGKGTEELRRAIGRAREADRAKWIEYKGPREEPIEGFLKEIEGELGEEVGVSRRCMALLALQEDPWALERVKGRSARVEGTVKRAKEALGGRAEYLVTMQRKRWASGVQGRTVSTSGHQKVNWSEKLSRALMNPWTGMPILAVVLYVGLYQFVGHLGAGTTVNFLEGTVFERWVNPFLTRVVEGAIPWRAASDLLVGEYGVLTLGMRYAVGIILPIVTFFFVAFAVIEDTGYLPRLAMLLDRLFKKMGLSGRAVIPMVLGFGCVTMATLVTRTLSTKRERMIAILLLSVAVPCSAQMGVIMALLSHRPVALLIWAGVMTGVYVAVGTGAARLIPGERAPFYVEIPPMRWPSPMNVARKTLARVKWYLLEIIPLFLIVSVLIWAGQMTGAFGAVTRAMEYPVKWIGLPAEAAKVFVLGFFRRDYGAAGLYDLNKSGALSGVQLLVAAVALTLFLPCVAQFLMTVKERSWKGALGITAVVLAVAFGVAFGLYHVLDGLGIML